MSLHLNAYPTIGGIAMIDLLFLFYFSFCLLWIKYKKEMFIQLNGLLFKSQIHNKNIHWFVDPAKLLETSKSRKNQIQDRRWTWKL